MVKSRILNILLFNRRDDSIRMPLIPGGHSYSLRLKKVDKEGLGNGQQSCDFSCYSRPES